MKFMRWGKDGGPESTVWGFWAIEIKSLFSIVLLKFEDGSRQAYHTHAFHCFSWVLRGRLEEMFVDDLHYLLTSLWNRRRCVIHKPSVLPFITRRSDFHKVESRGVSWVLSFRGPWAKEWREYIPAEDRYVTLTDGRRESTL